MPGTKMPMFASCSKQVGENATSATPQLSVHHWLESDVTLRKPLASGVNAMPGIGILDAIKLGSALAPAPDVEPLVEPLVEPVVEPEPDPLDVSW